MGKKERKNHVEQMYEARPNSLLSDQYLHMIVIFYYTCSGNHENTIRPIVSVNLSIEFIAWIEVRSWTLSDEIDIKICEITREITSEPLTLDVSEN